MWGKTKAKKQKNTFINFVIYEKRKEKKTQQEQLLALTKEKRTTFFQIQCDIK